jgi:iron complex transport system substrate-binding protein
MTPSHRRLLHMIAIAVVVVLPDFVGAQGMIRKVMDMEKQEVTLPVQIRKVATIGSVPPLNSLMFAMGAGDMLVNGLPEPFSRGTRWKYQAIFSPAMANKPIMQGPDRTPDMEVLLQAAPDLVLTMTRSLVDVMRHHNLPVVFLAWRQPDDVKAAMRLLGEIFDKPAVAERYAAYFDGVVARVAATMAQAGARRPTVLYLSAATLEQPHLIAEWWIAAAGGTSVTNDGRSTESKKFSLEQLFAWDPDVLILNAPSDRDIIARDERFRRLKAVANRHVYLIPRGAHTWAHRTVEQPLTVLWAAKTLHPEVFADMNLQAEVRHFYTTFFGVTLSAAQVQEILDGSHR